jgi:hypothetical protein
MMDETLHSDYELIAWGELAENSKITELSDRPWARVSCCSKLNIIFKELKLPTQQTLAVGHALSKLAGSSVPIVKKINQSGTKAIYEHHGGVNPSMNKANRDAMCLTYGGIQKKVQDDDCLKSILSTTTPHGYFRAALDVILESRKRRMSGDISPTFLAFNSVRMRALLEILRDGETLLRPYGDFVELAPQTINHCDLRYGNIAVRENGSVCIFDWDDACWGAPGWSLHSVFGSCEAVWNALDGNASSNDVHLIKKYKEILFEKSKLTEQQIIQILKATSLAGRLRHALAFMPFHFDLEGENRSIAQDCKFAMLDVAACIGRLSKESGIPSRGVALAFLDLGMKKKSDELFKETRYFRESLSSSDHNLLMDPTIFPEVQYHVCEKNSKEEVSYIQHAESLFRLHGALLIKSALPISIIETLKLELAASKRVKQDMYCERSVGSGRTMQVLRFENIIADPKLFAAQSTIPILKTLLGEDLILGSLTLVSAAPSAKSQVLHRDNPELFSKYPQALDESFSINLMIPLVRLNQIVGGTQVQKGTHRSFSTFDPAVPTQQPSTNIGDAYLVDSRVVHGGLANLSSETRPILSLVFQRPWYRDKSNFETAEEMIVEKGVLNALPDEQKSLVRWAVR